jgi:hypothetical protein
MIARSRMRRVLTRPRAGVLLALALLAAVGGASAPAFASDADYWKQTAERRDTVNRLFYDESPQAIPSAYDPVREAEEILRQREQTLAPSNPAARTLWRQIFDVTVRSALSTPLRAVGTLALIDGAAELGWKLGSGANAKYLKIGVPEPSPGDSAYDNYPEALEFLTQGTGLPGISVSPSLRTMPEDGWLWRLQAGRYVVEGAGACSHPLTAPVGPYVTITGDVQPTKCPGDDYWAPPRQVPLYAYYIPENDVGVVGPIENYNGQPYTVTRYAPSAPSQSATEGAIDQALGSSNAVLRQWLNYWLGSPGETDPTGVGAPNANIEFPGYVQHWIDHGQKFATPYDDPAEYWQDAAEIVERAEAGDADYIKCQRSDGDMIYWDPDKRAIVIVRDGKIVTYFPPPRGFDYFLEQCG